ncbi:MAG TPA: hypothetical protein VMX55_15210 [candidate division Zixibacteria bacterium]|nr:hypothetical protein [candidate division Zixibacteria bacterium]
MSNKEIKLIQKELKNTLDNPIIKLFYDNLNDRTKGTKEWTNLTKVQLETLVIDLLTDEINPNLGYLERGKVRGVTKRSFYRSLEQARLNLIRAIFTIMVAGVLNIIDSPRLADFNELSQNFVDLISINNLDNQSPEEKDNWIKIYTKMIFDNVQNLKHQTALSKPK